METLGLLVVMYIDKEVIMPAETDHQKNRRSGKQKCSQSHPFHPLCFLRFSGREKSAKIPENSADYIQKSGRNVMLPWKGGAINPFQVEYGTEKPNICPVMTGTGGA
jgi:hypothetical protein